MVLRVDDRSVQLRALGTDTEVPLHVSLLIDVSLSQRGMDKFCAHALLGMKAGLHRGRDHVNIYTFGSAVRLFHGGEDAGSLDAAAIEHIDSKGGAVLQKRPFYRIGGTRLFDAVSDAIANDKGVDGRKAILILSDGIDEDSNVTSGSALKSAEQGDVSISALEFAPTGPTFFSPGFLATSVHDTLLAISRASGGIFFHAIRGQEDEQIASVIRLLKEEYILYFPLPPMSPGPHRISISLANARPGASLHFRRRLWIPKAIPANARSRNNAGQPAQQ